ncbi:tRNA lysidine(34) synthetase TilS [Erythrobacter litoralis]|uniref:tRNA lysidine(34) synthetase TilS n=1 Tax=Erythrobacter litoralis TaxID=39960 RepID=UPI002435A3B4|nr:tRNA lysidine(34) synthetase TilS [Erythrobacter litoralis]MDG6077819.1 tRNA lysidine(34) synthetase TilS [Erythrobacter litoralis]
MVVSPKLVARFRDDLAALWPNAEDGKGLLGLAVSGGGDSLGMLLLAAAAMPGRVRAATVDHGLRPESAAEAAFVAERCTELGVQHDTLAVEVGDGNLQDRARAARYTALSQWCANSELKALATAHQLDDQVETLLMRLNRGSGLSGLSAIRAVQSIQDNLPLIRPVLGWRREELAKVVRDAGWRAIDDPSNGDDRFDRVRLRKVLGSVDWLDRANLARSAALLAEAEDSLEWAVEREVAERVRFDGEQASYAAGSSDAPALIRVEVVRALYRNFATSIDRRSAAEVVTRLTAEQVGNVAGLKFTVSGTAAELQWVFRREPTRRTG